MPCATEATPLAFGDLRARGQFTDPRLRAPLD